MCIEKKNAEVNEQWRDSYLLSFVPSKATVNIEGESSGHVYGGDAEPRRERLECPVPDFARHRHFPLLCSHDYFSSRKSVSLQASIEILLAFNPRKSIT